MPEYDESFGILDRDDRLTLVQAQTEAREILQCQANEANTEQKKQSIKRYAPYHEWPNFLMSLGCIALALHYLNLFDIMTPCFLNNKAQIYGSLAGIAASLLGFEITAATIYMTVAHEKYLRRFAKAGFLGPLFDTFVVAIKYAGIALVASVVGMFLDQNVSTRLSFPLELAATLSFLLSIARLTQTVAVLSDVGHIIMYKTAQQIIEDETPAEAL